MFLLSLYHKRQLKLLKLLTKGFETSVYWNEYKTKRDDKKTANEFRYYLESNFAGVSRLFVLVLEQKRLKTRRYYLLKGLIKNYNVIINGEHFYDQPINSDIKRYEKFRKLTTGQSEDYTTGFY